MRTKKFSSNFDFKVGLRERAALEKLADFHGLTCGGYLRMMILREESLMEAGKAN